MNQYLVYDLGGTFIKFALMNEKGDILDQDKVPSPTDNLEKLLGTMKDVADRYQGKFIAAAVSMPGRIDTKRGYAHTGGAYTNIINEIPFASLLEEKIEVPVVIANDGKCAAKAEAAFGVLRGVSDGCVIVLGTGTGGGIILNHDVWMGRSGGAGELSGLICDLRKYVKTGFSLNDFSSIYAGYGSATGLIALYAEKKGMDLMTALTTVDGIKFFEAYDAKEAEAVETLKDFGLYTAGGIMSVQCVLDLECYAIGGGISARKEVTESIKAGIDELFVNESILPFSKPNIVSCQFRNDANLIGALAFYLDSVKN